MALDETVVYEAWTFPATATPVPFVLDAVDTEGDALTYTLIGNQNIIGGTVTGTAPNLTFTPSEGFSGSISFTFTVNDGSLTSNEATVNIVVRGTQVAPVAFNGTTTTNEDTNVNITLRASDANGDPLTYTITSGPATGTISGTPVNTLTDIGPQIVYSPGQNVTGQVTFTFTAKDSFTNTSNIATITINITPVNDAPIANPQSVTLDEDTPEAITLTGSDIENSNLTFTIVTLPIRGTLSGTAPNIIYTPNANFNGSDSFTFTVTDVGTDSGPNQANLTSAPATVSLTITPVNDAPVANGQTVFTNEDTATPLFLIASDREFNQLTYAIVTQPTHGTLSCSNCPNPTYTPSLNYFGSDSFTFNVTDNGIPNLVSNTATVNINIAPINDAPVAGAQSIAVTEDTPKAITLSATDIENDPLTYSIITIPANGTLSGTPPNVTYSPNANYFGGDSFTFRANDGSANSNTATITITVNPVNDNPVANDDQATTAEDTPVTFSVTSNDTDLDGTVVASTVDLDPTTQAEDKTFSVAGQGTYEVDASGNVTFTPASNYNGTATAINYTVKDNSTALSNEAQIQITVTPVNDAPVVADINTTVVEDNQKTITLTTTDIENESVIFSIVTQPRNGVVTLNGATVVYTPSLNFTGTETFTYKANDGTDDSNVATITIVVTPVNDAPVIQQIPITLIAEDTDGTICFGLFDADGDNLTVDLPTNISGGGTITKDNSQNNCYIFRSALNYNGDTFWNVRVCDNGNPQLCSEKQFQITVTPVNDAPVANDDVLTVRSFEESEILNLLANDTDVENDQLVLTVTQLSGPTHGVITMSPGGAFQYKSELGYIGPDQITYEVCDTGTPKLCATATVNIDVVPPKFRIFEGLSPNNDGLNDYWRLNGIEDYPQNRVRVFDRYNNLVYDTRNYDNESNNWRGQANVGIVSGNLPDGTYFYIVEINDGNGPYSGFVVLKRN